MPLKHTQAKQAHRNLAFFLLVFIAVHFITHFASLGGISAHEETLGIARMLYRFPLVEMALVLGLFLQVLLGLSLLKTIFKRKRKGFWHWAQLLSACYLTYFIIMHTGAALSARFLSGLDTNFYWAAGTLAIEPLKYGFAPYYVLAITAITTHVIAALHFRGPKRWHAIALAAGPLMGIAFVLGYGGACHSFDLPQEYREFYADFPGVRS